MQELTFKEKLEQLPTLPDAQQTNSLGISAKDLGEYSADGYTYLSEVIRAGNLPILAKHAPEAIQDPALWLKPNKPVSKFDGGGNSLHAAAEAGHMAHVPDKVKTAPNLLTANRLTMNVFHICAKRGELDHLPDRLKTKENLMSHTADFCSTYIFSADFGKPEQIPKDQWTGDVLFFTTQKGLSAMAVLRDRGKMDLLLGLDFDEKYKDRFGEWWEENEKYKQEKALAEKDQHDSPDVSL